MIARACPCNRQRKKENSMARLKKLICPRFGTEMNHHAEKLVYESGSAENRGSNQSGVEVHACHACVAGLMTKDVPDIQD